MRVFFYFGAAGLLAAASVARAECDDLLNLSLPLSGDTALQLSSAAIECPILADDLLQEFVIEGGTLTLSGPSTTQFENLKFTVMDGAGLIFDFDKTQFGGDDFASGRQDDYDSIMLNVLSGGFAEFTGEMTAKQLTNMKSVFGNEAGGSIKFASTAVFDNSNANVFRDNYGKLRFYGDVTFNDNNFIAIANDGGTIRIDGDAVFEGNGRSFDGHNGGALANTDGGTVIFRGTATFSANWCDGGGGAVFNGPDSKITFYKKASFYNNHSRSSDGGGVDNYGGVMKFRGAVDASDNEADKTGGGIATGNGGTTTFYGWTTIKSNSAYRNGGGLSAYRASESDGGSLVTFRKSNKIRISDNVSSEGCNNVYVDDNSELVGYGTTSDVCD